MKKALYIGKHEGNSVRLELTIEEKNKQVTTVNHETIDSYKTLSIVGSILTGGGGQIHGTLREGLSEYAIPKENVDRILDIWEEYHLNDLNAGCEHQDTINVNDVNWTERAAEETDKCPHGYRYGSAWLVRLIPNEIIEEITALFNGEEFTPEQKMIVELEAESDVSRKYQIENQDIILTLVYTDTMQTDIGYGNVYTVKVENKRLNEVIEFPFHDSIHNTQEKEVLHDDLISDILSIVKVEYFDDEEQYPTFEDFCHSLGYNRDSRKDEKLYHDVIKHAKDLQRVFDEKLLMSFPD